MGRRPSTTRAAEHQPAAAGARVARLFDEHARMVVALCRVLLEDPHEAEDATQQTFLSAYRSLARGAEPRDERAWLAAIARNECSSRRRKRTAVMLPLLEGTAREAAPDAADIADRRDELAAVKAAIAKLPRRQREALVLRDFHGLSYRDAAAALSVSPPAAEVLVFRARKRVRDLVRRSPGRVLSLPLPVTAREELSRLLPGFDSATAASVGAGAAAGALAKVAAAPPTAKLAAATVAAVAAGVAAAPRMADPASHSPAQAVADVPVLVAPERAAGPDGARGRFSGQVLPVLYEPSEATPSGPERSSGSGVDDAADRARPGSGPGRGGTTSETAGTSGGSGGATASGPGEDAGEAAAAPALGPSGGSYASSSGPSSSGSGSAPSVPGGTGGDQVSSSGPSASSGSGPGPSASSGTGGGSGPSGGYVDPDDVSSGSGKSTSAP